MALKDILVHISDTPHCAGRVEYALKLAQSTGATLTGTYTQADPKVPHSAEQDLHIIGANTSIDERRQLHRDRSARLQAEFEAAGAKLGVPTEWHRGAFTSSSSVIHDQMIFFTQQADLVIVGQHNAETCVGRVPPDLPERLSLETGRPVVVVPYAGTFTSPPERVLVAWDNGKESVRAINDAIPMMASAKSVKVVEVNPPKQTKHYERIPLESVVQHLVRHGIPAKGDQLNLSGIDVGNVLLNAATDSAADLLVMGSYGHHRFRELILGGVTRHIMTQMTLPILISH